jgi:ubiquinone/menaquinone biosynthesis C-methylase UbiE
VKDVDSIRKLEQQREHYATIAAEFDRKYNRENANHYYKIEQIEEAFERFLVPSEQGWDLMEIGAGSGIHAQHVLRRLGPRIRNFVLSDLSAEMLDLAKNRIGDDKKVQYFASPAESITLDRKFDGIYISGSMHHFSDYRQSIRALRSQLNRDGILVICEPNVWNPINLVKALKDYSLEVGQFSVTKANITRTLEEEGFEVLSQRVLHFRSGNRTAERLFPYKELEKLSVLNFLAIMFLVVARVKVEPTA